MALEGTVADPQVVDQPVADPKPQVVEPQQKPASSSSTQEPDPAKNIGADDAKQKGILADLQKERKARQAFERQFTEITARLAERDRQIQALTGAKSPSPQDAEVDEIRGLFARVYPGLAKLDDQQVERLLKLADNASGLEETTSHYWRDHGERMLTAVEEAVANEFGGKLSQRQQQALNSAYVYAIENNQELAERHLASDKTLADEFAKNWVEDWLEPARRKVTATEIDRQRRVPSGRDRSMVSTGAKKIDFTNPKAVEDAMVASFKEHGGTFGD
jgi:hypothetical protein